MYGLKALQADGLVAQRQEVKPAVQMRNSVDTYYRNVLPTAKTSSYTFNRFRSQPPRGWAAPTSTPSWRSLDSCTKLPIFKIKKMLLYKKFLLFISLIPNT